MASQVQLTNLHLAVPAARASFLKWGIPASVTLAQWIPESTWGTSELAVKGNNYFGVKCSHLRKPDTYIEMPTHEYVSGKRVLVMADFAKYVDAAASFDDHGKLLATAARYKPAMAVASSPELFATQLQICGYSTNPSYATGLMQFMRLYNLKQYDITPPVKPAALETA